MNTLCLLGMHHWKRIGTIEAIRTESAFSAGLCHSQSALGECARCGKRALRACSGRFTWYREDEVTEAEYMEKFKSGEFALDSPHLIGE